MILLGFLALHLTNDTNKQNTVSNYLTVSNMGTKRAVFEGNIRFIINETIEDLASGKVIDKAEILLGVNNILQEYLIQESFENVSLDSAKFNINVATKDSNRRIYNYTITDSNITKQLSYDGLDLLLKVPTGYEVGGVIE